VFQERVTDQGYMRGLWKHGDTEPTEVDLSVSLCLCVSNPPRHRLRLLVRQFCLQIGHFLLQPLDLLVE